MFTTRRVLAAAPAVLAALLLAGCTGVSSPPASDDGGNGDSGQTTQTQAPDDSGSDDADGGAEASGEGCWVHLFDGDDFDENDANFTLAEAGEFSDLSDLPGADQDWTDEADSIKVGPDATVTIWPKKDFAGQPQKLEAGSEHPDVDDEPSSMKVVC